MNARFDTNTPKEAAKALGVSEGVVVGWCRNGVINCNRVGEGTQKDRYEITDDEVHYLRTIILKFGVKDGMLRYRKDWKNMEKPATKAVKSCTTKPIDCAKEYTAQEVAKYLNVDKTTVNSWCRNDKINCRKVENVGGRGNSYYYAIPEWEVNYIKSLYDKYGSKNRFSGAMAHYEKYRPGIPASDIVTKTDNETTKKAFSNLVKKLKDTTSTQAKETAYSPDDTKLLDTIHYIRDVKARIEDCKNELALLEKEYEDLKAELVGKI